MARLYFASLSELRLSSLECYCGDIPGSTLLTIKAKCRELSRSDSLVLTSPQSSCYDCHSMYIVSKTGYVISDAQFKAKLSSFGINVTGRVQLTLSILQLCYQFTLIARLAPKWNEIGNDIFETVPVEELDIGVTTEHISLSIDSYKVTFNFLKPEDLQVSTTLLSRFKSDPSFALSETYISSNQCIVLPKYPGCCVCHTRPIAVSCKDIDELSIAFVNDVHSRMASLCGSIDIKFSKKPFAPLNKIQPSNQIVHSYATNVRPVTIRPKATNIALGFPNLPPIAKQPLHLPPAHTVENKENDRVVPMFKGSSTKVPQLAGHRASQTKVPQLAGSKYIPLKRTCSDDIHQFKPCLKKPCLSLETGGTSHNVTLDKGYSINTQLSTSTDIQIVPSTDTVLSTQLSMDHTTVTYTEVRGKKKCNSSSIDFCGIPPSTVKEIKKTKIPLMKTWLQKHGIRYNSKDKKEDLMKLIVEHLKATGIHYTIA